MPFWEGTLNFANMPAYEVLGNDNLTHVKARLALNQLDSEFEVVLPKDNELQIDFDTKDIPVSFWETVPTLKEAFGLKHEPFDATTTTSRNGNLHLTIKLPFSLTSKERIMWQALLGSDMKREVLGASCIYRGIANPTLFIERKGVGAVKTFV